jgi:hypothetical protein
MAMQEFYIRNESDTEARGPFNLEQLASLIDSGQLTLETLFYDAINEQWAIVGSNPELKATLFPEKKKLAVRAKPRIDPLDQADDDTAPITVDDMIAAAEGRTPDTKDKKDRAEDMARAAAIGRWAAIVALILAAAGEMLPAADAIVTLDPAKLIAQPFALLGVLDLFLAVMLALGVVTLYPFVRFRAALGFGLLGFIFWIHGQTLPFLALAAGCAGLYFCTITVSYIRVGLCSLLAIGGLGLASWQLFSQSAVEPSDAAPKHAETAK